MTSKRVKRILSFNSLSLFGIGKKSEWEKNEINFFFLFLKKAYNFDINEINKNKTRTTRITLNSSCFLLSLAILQARIKYVLIEHLKWNAVKCNNSSIYLVSREKLKEYHQASLNHSSN